jgi:hypothetical protein
MSETHSYRLFIDEGSVSDIIGVCKNVLTDTGFAYERVDTGDKGLITPEKPDKYLQENKFKNVEFAHTDVEHARAEMWYPTEPTEDYPYYSIGIMFPKTVPMYDRELQQDIVQLASGLSERLDVFYAFLEPISDTIVKSAEQMQNRPNLGYVTYLREDLAEQLEGDVSSAPYCNIESVGGGYLIVPEGDLFSETQISELASYLETSHV